MNLILLEPSDFVRGGVAALTGRRARHIREVLKASPGQILRVGMLDGPKGTGKVLESNEQGATLECLLDAEPPAPSGLSLLLALPRPKVMKRLWSVLASFGLDEILVTNAARVERSYFETHWLEPERFTPLLREGLEQGGATRFPKVSVVRRLKPLVEDEVSPRAATTFLLRAAPGAAARLTSIEIPRSRPILIAVGPEGGWTGFEDVLFRNAGFLDVSLGSSTLRSDVACMAVLGILTCLRA